jgi:hypothetical protein
MLILFTPTLQAQSLDSLAQHLNLSGSQVEQHADSIRQSLDSVAQQTRASIDSMQQHLQERIDSLAITRTLDTLHHHYGAAQESLESGLRPADAKLPSLSALPPSPTHAQLPTTLPDRFPASQALERVKLFRTKASQYTQQLRGQIQQGTQAIQKAPSALEQQAAKASGLDMLEQPSSATHSVLGGSLSGGSDQLSAAAAANPDPDQVQQQMKQRLAQEARRHFARHSDALQEGQQQLSKLKQKYKAVQTEQDKFERATSLKGEPWTARLLLGSYLQFYREPSFQVDLSPFVGYRFNTRWSVGVGGSYRAAIRRVPGSAPIYQGRMFVEGEVYRGFAAHVAYERSGLSSPVLSRGEDRAVVDQHLLVGIGKSYRITRKVQGTTLLLYRPGDIDQSLPLSRWNLRTGFALGW